MVADHQKEEEYNRSNIENRTGGVEFNGKIYWSSLQNLQKRRNEAIP